MISKGRHLLGILFLAVVPAASANPNFVWRQDLESFTVSDSPYKGWKIASGEARVDSSTTPPTIHFSNPQKPNISAYHYIPFLNAQENPESFLQIRSNLDGEPFQQYATAGNVSSDGGILGPFAKGITTYCLAQHRYFTENTAKKRNWALKIWAAAHSVRIEDLSLCHELSDGLVIQPESITEGSAPVEGQKIKISLHTTDATLRDRERIDVELIARLKIPKTTIQPWSHSGGPRIELRKVKTGLFAATITLDKETVELIQSSPKEPVFGVRTDEGSTPMLSWLFFPGLIQASTAGIDWQHRIGEDTGSHNTWRELTKGENLVQGKPLRYIPAPNYHLTTDENDPLDLTDGKLSSRKDDRIWFRKDAVGWYGAGGAIPQVTILADLGKVQPIGQISIRLLGGKEQGSLRLPNEIEFYASDDGKAYHQLGYMVKLMPAERALSDFKTAFYVAEEQKAFVHAFSCREAVNARYVAIKIRPEASVFTDEIAILKASEGESPKSLAAYPVKTLFTDGVVAQFRAPELTLFPNLAIQNWITVERFSSTPYKDLKVEIDLPESIEVVPTSDLKVVARQQEPGRKIWQVADVQAIKQSRFPLYFERKGNEPLDTQEKAVLSAIVDGTPSHRITFPIRERILPPVALPENLDLSLAWMGFKDQIGWPNFFSAFRRLGFDSISVFPRYWQRRDAARTWINSAKESGLQFIADARAKAYRIVMNESPFHEMVHTFNAAEKEGSLARDDAEAFFLKNALGVPTKNPNPFYRGTFYQREIQRVRNLVAETKPDYVFWDIELWWKSVSLARNDQRIVEKWRNSGKEWNDFVTDCGTEMLRDLYLAVKDAVGQGKMPEIGLYGAYAAQGKPCDGLFQWDKIYPKYITLSMPSLYVQGRTADVRKRIIEDFPLVGRNIIPWFTAGTYGPVPPPSVESMVLETILNGARGITWYEYRDFDPLHFFHYTRAVSILSRFKTLLMEGSPRSYEGSNPHLSYTCYASEKEALILVGNYSRSPDTKTTLYNLFKRADTIRIDTPASADTPVSSKEEWSVDVPPGHYALFYQQLVKHLE